MKKDCVLTLTEDPSEGEYLIERKKTPNIILNCRLTRLLIIIGKITLVLSLLLFKIFIFSIRIIWFIFNKIILQVIINFVSNFFSYIVLILLIKIWLVSDLYPLLSKILSYLYKFYDEDPISDFDNDDASNSFD